MEYLDIDILLAGSSYSNKVECSNMYKNHIESQIDSFNNNINQFQEKIEEIVATNTSG